MKCDATVHILCTKHEMRKDRDSEKSIMLQKWNHKFNGNEKL